MRVARPAGLLLLIASCGPTGPQSTPPTKVGSSSVSAAAEFTRTRILDPRIEVPDVSFLAAGGERIELKSFAGRVVVLSLWATWCSPCVEEMPTLNRLAGLLPMIAVVPVNLDAHGAAAAARFIERHALLNLSAYHDSQGQLMGLLGARGLPTSLVIDRTGRIAAVVEGAIDWTSTQMLEWLPRV